MGALALLLGIILATIIAMRPAEKLLFSPTLKVIIAFLCSVFAAYIFVIAMQVPQIGAYFLGQVFSCVLIIIICVAIGNAIRKKKSTK
jgi:ABC-type polysaccharide/polyol phosphate export permease